MLERRTDLAMEARELLEQEGHSLPGIESHEEEAEGFPLTTVRVVSPEGAQALGKPEGVYHTLDLAGLSRREERPSPGRLTLWRGSFGLCCPRKGKGCWWWGWATGPSPPTRWGPRPLTGPL